MKRFASHYLYIPTVGFLKQQVVELKEGLVSNVFPLTEEIESVEWLPGVIVLCAENQFCAENELSDIRKELSAFCKHSTLSSLAAEDFNTLKMVPFLLYPFDFILMQPVAETRHRQLR